MRALSPHLGIKAGPLQAPNSLFSFVHPNTTAAPILLWLAGWLAGWAGNPCFLKNNPHILPPQVDLLEVTSFWVIPRRRCQGIVSGPGDGMVTGGLEQSALVEFLWVRWCPCLLLKAPEIYGTPERILMGFILSKCLSKVSNSTRYQICDCCFSESREKH